MNVKLSPNFVVKVYLFVKDQGRAMQINRVTSLDTTSGFYTQMLNMHKEWLMNTADVDVSDNLLTANASKWKNWVVFYGVAAIDLNNRIMKPLFAQTFVKAHSKEQIDEYRLKYHLGKSCGFICELLKPYLMALMNSRTSVKFQDDIAPSRITNIRLALATVVSYNDDIYNAFVVYKDHTNTRVTNALNSVHTMSHTVFKIKCQDGNVFIVDPTAGQFDAVQDTEVIHLGNGDACWNQLSAIQCGWGKYKVDSYVDADDTLQIESSRMPLVEKVFEVAKLMVQNNPHINPIIKDVSEQMYEKYCN